MEKKYSIREIEEMLTMAERYKKLKKQGRLVELPCSVETMVYKVVPDCKGCEKGTDPESCSNKLRDKCKKKVMPCLFTLDLLPEYGKTVFKTESEAVVASVS